MTATLSVEAVQATVIELVVAPVTWSPPGVVGAWVSAVGAQALVEAVTVASDRLVFRPRLAPVA